MIGTLAPVDLNRGVARAGAVVSRRQATETPGGQAKVAAPMLSSGWSPEREVAPAWYGARRLLWPCTFGLSVFAHSGDRGREPSRLEARGGLAGL